MNPAELTNRLCMISIFIDDQEYGIAQDKLRDLINEVGQSIVPPKYERKYEYDEAGDLIRIIVCKQEG